MTPVRRVAAAVLALACATGANGQTLITPEEFLDYAVGRTLEFHDVRFGALVGTEQFLSRRLTVWKRPDRACIYGEIEVTGRQICFTYERDPNPGPVCWWPFREGERVFVRIADFAKSEIQEARPLGDNPLDCPSQPTS